MERSSPHEKEDYTNGNSHGSAEAANSSSNIHPSLQGYVRSSRVKLVTPPSHLQPSFGGSQVTSPKQTGSESTGNARLFGSRHVTRGSHNAPRVPIKPARPVDKLVPSTSSESDDRDILYPLREVLSSLGPKPSILKSPGSKGSLGKKTVSVNTGQSTIVHVRDPLQYLNQPSIPPTYDYADDFSEVSSDIPSTLSQVYSTVIPLGEPLKLHNQSINQPDNVSVTSSARSNGSVLSLDTRFDDTASSHLSHQTDVSQSIPNPLSPRQPMVSTIFLPPERSSIGGFSNSSKMATTQSSMQTSAGNIAGGPSTTYRSTDGVFTVAISDTDSSSVISASVQGHRHLKDRPTAPSELRRKSVSIVKTPSESSASSVSRDAGIPRLQRPSVRGGRDGPEELSRPVSTLGSPPGASRDRGTTTHEVRKVHQVPSSHSSYRVQETVRSVPSRSVSTTLDRASARGARSTTGLPIRKVVHQPGIPQNIDRLHSGTARLNQSPSPHRFSLASPERYRILPIHIQHDSPSEYSASQYSEDYSEYSVAESVSSTYSDERTPTISYASSDSQFSSTPSASLYSSEDQYSSRRSNETATSERTGERHFSGSRYK